jgi:hypothetical protein
MARASVTELASGLVQAPGTVPALAPVWELAWVPAQARGSARGSALGWAPGSVLVSVQAWARVSVPV